MVGDEKEEKKKVIYDVERSYRIVETSTRLEE